MSIQVVIADDQQLVRAGFRKILEAEDDIADRVHAVILAYETGLVQPGET